MVQPRININVESNFRLGGGIPFATAALIGSATWGEDSVVKEFESFSDIKNHFKSGTIVDGTEQFFATGGRSIAIVRVVDGTEDKASKVFNNGATPVITIEGKYNGTHGNNISVSITANSTTPANRDIKLTDGIIIETYENLATNSAIATALNAGNLVNVTVEAGHETSDIVDAITATLLTGGLDGASSLSNSSYTTAISDKLWLKNWDYLIIPGETDDSLHTSISSLLDTRAVEENKYSIYVTGVTKFETISTAIARTAKNNSGNLIVVHSSLYIGSSTPLEDSIVTNYLDGSYTACAYAGLLCRLPVNSSPTYKNIGILTGKTATDTNYTRLERENLISQGFTIITETITGVIGARMGVNRTTTNTEWYFLTDNVRKVNYIKSQINELSQTYIGQPNDGSTRNSIKATITGFYRELVDDRIIESYDVEVLKGTDPRAVNINTDVVLINETDYIDVNLILNV